MSSLFERSVEIILQNQAPGGAFVASPNFPTYDYCWYRDSSFIAYAMDKVGEHQSAAQFHNWAATTITRRSDVIGRAVEKARHGEQLLPADVLHTRYTVNGDPASEDWPNFQLDGFGTWLWALGEHAQAIYEDRSAASNAGLSSEWLSAAALVADYLSALWDRPCYDCWEEFPDNIHPHTLAAIYGGLSAHQKFGGIDHSSVLSSLRSTITQSAIKNNHLVKFIGADGVDASLLGLAIPYRLVAADDPVMVSTVAAIEKTLMKGAGLHRYAEDSYYGGGEWILLTAWLGWYYAEIGEQARAQQARVWIEAQIVGKGYLPEQVPISLNAPEYYDIWCKRWGGIATPLLWSHAKYIILYLLTSESG